MDPKSNILKDVHQRYNRTFLPGVNLSNLPFCRMISGVHNLFNRYDHPKGLKWKDIDPSTPENLPLAHSLVNTAWLSYQTPRSDGQKKVPRWVLHFSLHSLLWRPEPSASVIASCLMIVAIDLGCDVSESYIRNPDKRYVFLTQLHSLLS